MGPLPAARGRRRRQEEVAKVQGRDGHLHGAAQRPQRHAREVRAPLCPLLQDQRPEEEGVQRGRGGDAAAADVRRARRAPRVARGLPRPDDLRDLQLAVHRGARPQDGRRARPQAAQGAGRHAARAARGAEGEVPLRQDARLLCRRRARRAPCEADRDAGQDRHRDPAGGPRPRRPRKGARAAQDPRGGAAGDGRRDAGGGH
mmetsp:Transcript_22736/g.72752  ORF Transcript_22736/g.72752 Transcript_22736/m.72752 type:complete len:202 (-) Transcript_22736:423-1028(-)